MARKKRHFFGTFDTNLKMHPLRLNGVAIGHGPMTLDEADRLIRRLGFYRVRKWKQIETVKELGQILYAVKWYNKNPS